MKASLLSLALVASFAHAETSISISAGDPGGTYYDVFSANLQKVVAEYGIDLALMESEGSRHNLERVTAGEAALGFTQSDVLSAWLKDHPTAALEILAPLGQECVYIAVREDGPIDDLHDLTQEGIDFAVGSMQSGSSGTFDFLARLEPDFRAPNIYFQGGKRTLGAVASGQLDAFMWVTSPHNLEHHYLEIVMREGSGLKLIDVDDWDLNDKLPNGSQVYTFRDVVVKEGFFDQEIETACMSVQVVADARVDAAVLDDVAGALLLNRNRIAGE